MAADQPARVHFFGVRLNGVLTKFIGGICDAEFIERTKLGLPPGWVAWHLEPGENVDNSERVQELRRLPIAVEVSGALVAFHHGGGGLVVCPYPFAHYEKHLAAALSGEAFRDVPSPHPSCY